MPNKAGGLTENEIQLQCRQYLQIKGWLVIRIQQGIGCHLGISDLIAVKDGKTVYIEIKTPKGKLSQHQENFRKDIEYHGAEYLVFKDVSDAMSFANRRIVKVE